MDEKVTADNRQAFIDYFNLRPRLRYPNLMFVHFFMRYVSPDKTVKKGLSIGSGDGAHEFVAVREGVEMTCTDVSDVAVNRVKKFAAEDRLAIKTAIVDQTDLSMFDDNSFDLVISWAVVSYGTEETGRKALSEIHRVLRKGGHFVGTLESDIHTSILQPGVKKLGPRTYQMPDKVEIFQPHLVCTYYSEGQVRAALQSFTDVSLALDILHPPAMLRHQVGQWLYHCRKG